jgi:hypothetical protein
MVFCVLSQRNVTRTSQLLYNARSSKLRILKIAIGIILLGGAAWATVRTYKGRGKASWTILLFALFLVTLGSYFIVDSVGAYVRELRIGSEWLK